MPAPLVWGTGTATPDQAAARRGWRRLFSMVLSEQIITQRSGNYRLKGEPLKAVLLGIFGVLILSHLS